MAAQKNGFTSQRRNPLPCILLESSLLHYFFLQYVGQDVFTIRLGSVILHTMNAPIDLLTRPARKVLYPESDGKPMAENTVQFRYIVMIEGGLEAVFRHDANVFVAGDLFWYPVEGDNTIVQAPDTLVVFGRPRGDRRCYMQWLEDNIAPQVVFEVLSPGNRPGEIVRKFQFYEKYGVEEYYVYDPDGGTVAGWQRLGDKLQEIPSMERWISPRLQVRFELVDGELHLYGPDGKRFATYVEVVEQRDRERLEKEQHRQRAEQEKQRAERLAARLRELGIEPD